MDMDMNENLSGVEVARVITGNERVTVKKNDDEGTRAEKHLEEHLSNLGVLDGAPRRAMVLLTAGDSPEADLYHLAETKLEAGHALVISNIEHGLAEGGGSVTEGDPHASFTFVNPNLGDAAGVAACEDQLMVKAWLELVEGNVSVEVVVLQDCSYGQIFLYLLQKFGLIAIGATLLLRPRLCTKCFQYHGN